jgi:hypothetical protein
MQVTERRPVNWLKWLLIIGGVVLIGAAVWLTAVYFRGASGNNQKALSPENFEEVTGIRVTLIAVTGGGGMVDFRIKVLDAEKATALFANPENRPILIAEDSDIELLAPSDMTFDVGLEADRGYFTLYANSNKAIQRGAPVTVVIGDYRLEPIDAQ